MEGTEFYCVVYNYCVRFIELRAWFATSALTRLSILCCENSADSYLDDCFWKPCYIDKTRLDLCACHGKNCPKASINALMVLIKETHCDLLFRHCIRQDTSQKAGIHIEKLLFSAASWCLFLLFLSRQHLMEFGINWNKPVHHPPAGSNIPLPQGVMCYWETMAMPKISTVTRTVCVSMWSVPFRKSHDPLTTTHLWKFFLSLPQPVTQPRTHKHQIVVSFTTSQYVLRRNKHMALWLFFFLPKRCMAMAIFRNWLLFSKYN